MGEHSKIEWTDHTFNPWIGCTKVSHGCTNCYAEALDKRGFGGGHWGKGAPRKRTSVENWNKPRLWDRKAAKAGRRDRVFCASLADIFDPEVPDEWRHDVFRLVATTPNLDWLLVTKRPEKMRDYILGAIPGIKGAGPAKEVFRNVWLGVTVENQEQANTRLPVLFMTPAAKRFISVEPMLGPVDLLEAEAAGALEYPIEGHGRLDWVICGGESGARARPMFADWVRSLRDQCLAAGIPFLFKQWGEHGPSWYNDENGQKIPGSEWMGRCGKKIAGRLLDGREWNEVPK